MPSPVCRVKPDGCIVRSHISHLISVIAPCFFFHAMFSEGAEHGSPWWLDNFWRKVAATVGPMSDEAGHAGCFWRCLKCISHHPLPLLPPAEHWDQTRDQPWPFCAQFLTDLPQGSFVIEGLRFSLALEHNSFGWWMHKYNFFYKSMTTFFSCAICYLVFLNFSCFFWILQILIWILIKFP